MNRILVSIFVSLLVLCPAMAQSKETITAVDLGLSVKWADKNIGAERKNDIGSFFTWDEIETKAAPLMEKKWRTPTYEEIKELIAECTWTLASIDRIIGYKVTGPNGNWIFLPASGWRDDSGLHGLGNRGYYWSSTLDEEDNEYARILFFERQGVGDEFRHYCNRLYGLPIRSVTE